ncbi:general transcription factor II-I repeat domain-containing protein 2-like [Rhineura floridana]|uniref:general transcription factor II-I repeat domain-containing protein 2-like n=1 Tax=Rhineura floridana TaxID=261503 RepID=UPI002AC89408|nr:general transcription factor II-I repeat domain-containing protein 2-like [Rhineura floridana]
MESSAVEMELIELQEDLGLKMIHKSQSTTEFWKQVPEIKYPELKKTSVRLISIFSTTYCCESLYSVMKFVKSKHHAILTNQHLTELIRTSLTTYQPDFRLTAKMETHKTSTSSK